MASHTMRCAARRKGPWLVGPARSAAWRAPVAQSKAVARCRQDVIFYAGLAGPSDVGNRRQRGFMNRTKFEPQPGVQAVASSGLLAAAIDELGYQPLLAIGLDSDGWIHAFLCPTQ